MVEQEEDPTTAALVATANGGATAAAATETAASTAAAVVAAAAVAATTKQEEEEDQDQKPAAETVVVPTASPEAMETVRQQFKPLEGSENTTDAPKPPVTSSIAGTQEPLICSHCDTVRKETSPVALAKHLMLCYKTPIDLKKTVLSSHSMFREVILAGALAGMGPTQCTKVVTVSDSIHLKVEEGSNAAGNIVQTCSFCSVTWAAPQFLQSKWDTHLLEQCPSAPLDLKLLVADNCLAAKCSPLEPQTIKKPFWEHVTSIKEEDSNVLLQTCKYCGFHRRSQNFRRPMWIHHLSLVCTKVPPSVKASFGALTSGESLAGTKRGRSFGATSQQPAPKFPIRDHFDRTPQPDGKVLQTCKYCEESRLSHQIQVTTWTEHMIKCTGFPRELKLEIVKLTTSHKVLELAHARNIWPKEMEGTFESLVPVAKKQRRDASTATGGGGGSTSTAALSMKEHVICAPPNPIDERILQTCKYCNTMTRNSRQFQTTKWSEHIVECPAAPLEVKRLIVSTNTSVLVQRAAAQEVLEVDENVTNQSANIINGGGIKAETAASAEGLVNKGTEEAPASEQSPEGMDAATAAAAGAMALSAVGASEVV